MIRSHFRFAATACVVFFLATIFTSIPPASAVVGKKWSFTSERYESTENVKDQSYFATIAGSGMRFGFKCRHQQDAAGKTLVAAPYLYMTSEKPLQVEAKDIQDGQVYDVVMTIDNDRFTMPMTATVNEKTSRLQIGLDFSKRPVLALLAGLKKARSASFNGTDWSLRGSSKAIGSLIDACR